MKQKALIVSIKGTKLTKMERVLFSKEKPWGTILFKRNLKSIDQIRYLISQIKKLTKNSKFPIMVDEEGSSVSRLKDIINHNFNANFFGNLFNHNNKICLSILNHYINSICIVLKDLGININTVPVLMY